MFHHSGIVWGLQEYEYLSMPHLDQRRCSRTHVQTLRRSASASRPDPGHKSPALATSLTQSRFLRPPPFSHSLPK